MVSKELDSMTEQEIIEEAERRGYIVRDAPAHYAKPGYRIVEGPLAASGVDSWMLAANNRLCQIQTA